MKNNSSQGLLSKLWTGFTDSLIDECLEADLRHPGSDAEEGEISFYRHSKGFHSFLIELPGSLDLPSGAGLSVFVDDERLRDLVYEGEKIRLRVSSRDESSLPEARVGDVAEVRHGDDVLLSGVFEED
ncbi:MAG: hypothetical protein MPN21_23885 [Thermoanaerobaculia bacterium]|nr:hypothetical protein [Thermoanaerobaculia bacterium]